VARKNEPLKRTEARLPSDKDVQFKAGLKTEPGPTLYNNLIFDL
jgi:hypothetical protein